MSGEIGNQLQHYRAFNGRRVVTPNTCSIDGCDAVVFARGWCGTHYHRWYRTGDVREDTPIGNPGPALGSTPNRNYQTKLPKMPLDHVCEEVACSRLGWKWSNGDYRFPRCEAHQRTLDGTSRPINSKKAEKQELVNHIKATNPCADCAQLYPPWVMDFDHVTGDKVLNVAAMVARAFSLENILTEISKCEVVCANCHRERTHDRRWGGDLSGR